MLNPDISPGAHLEDLADQGEAVGVDAGGCQGQHGVALADGGAVDDGVLFDGTHCEAGHIVLAGLIEPRHLRRLRQHDLAESYR